MFNKETGERIIKDTTGIPPLFQEVFGNPIWDLAEQNNEIIGVTPPIPT